MSSIKISTLKDPKSDEVIELLARAFITTPIHVAIFGGTGEKELQLERIFWRVGTELVFRSEWYAALDGDRTVGVMHMVKSPQCRLSSDQQEAVGPRLAELGPDTAPRVAEVLGDWAKRDPDTDHYHLGPIAVHQELQNRGIGSLLMKHFCQRADETSILGYLETDSSDNVRFYGKSGFEIAEQTTLLDVTNWFMTRTARAVS